LLHQEHGDLLDGHEEWVEGVCPVKEGIVLQTNLAPVIEKRLEILVVVVQVVLAREEGLDDVRVGPSLLLHLPNIREGPEAASDVARLERLALVCRDDAHGVVGHAVVVPLRLDANEIELLPSKAQRVGRDGAAAASLGAQLGRDGLAIHLVLGDDHEADGVNRNERPRRQDGSLHALLPAAADETTQVGEVAKVRLVNRRLCSDGKGPAHLSDHDADLARRHLHPGKPGHGVNQERLEAQARH
jgi:hypothetical protein